MCSTTRGPAIWPFLGDVPDQDHRDAAPLGEGDELVRRRAHLRDRARRAVDVVDPHRLDRVDHHQRRPLGLQRGQDVAQAGLGGQPQRRVRQARAGRRAAAPAPPPPRRRRRSPARRGGEARRRLQQQGRLADAGIAADQHRRGRHQPAAEHPVELGDPASRRAAAAAPRRRRAPVSSTRRPRPAPRRASRPAGRAGRRPRRSLFHAPQASQRPAHFACVAPHSVQTNWAARLMGGAAVSRVKPRVSG